MAEKEKDKEDAKEGEAPAAEAPKKSNKKMLLIVGGVIFLVLAIGAPVAFFTLKGGTEEKKTEEVGADAAQEGGPAALEGQNEEEDVLDEGEEALGAIFPLDTFTVNLSGGRYIRAQIQLEFRDREVPKRLYGKLVPLRDSIIAVLSTRTAEDLSNEKGRAALKGEIKDLVNELMHKEEVKRVYFTQFLVS